MDISKILATIDTLANNTYELLDNTFEKIGITDNIKGDERMAICNSCQQYKSSSSMCTVCGCYMVLKTKLTHSVCPENKW